MTGVTPRISAGRSLVQNRKRSASAAAEHLTTATKRQRAEPRNTRSAQVEQPLHEDNHAAQSKRIQPNSSHSTLQIAEQHIQRTASCLRLQRWQVQHAIRLLQDGNTVPFVARYRKEATGQLTEEQLRKLQAFVTKLQALDGRRQAIINSLQQQGVKDAQLLQQIQNAESLAVLEDLYLPYKPKRSTRANAAKDKGLQPLCDRILASVDSHTPPKELAKAFVGKQVSTVDEALAGACDIIAQLIADSAAIRKLARDKAHFSVVTSQASRKTEAALKAKQTGGGGGNKGKGAKAALPQKSTKANQLAKNGANKTASANDPSTYSLYTNFRHNARSIKSHQVLALNRGESLGFLTVKLEWDVGQLAPQSWSTILPSTTGKGACAGCVRDAINDGLTRLLKPSIDREVRAELTERAVEEAIATFASNVRSILLAPPMKCGTVLGIDPGFKNGCKMAVCGPTGAVLDTAVIYPHTGQQEQAEKVLAGLLVKHKVAAVAVGDGVASHQTEQFLAKVLKNGNKGSKAAGTSVGWVVVSEAGASIYSASPLAAQELPNLDITLRGAVSLARRLLDPLAELVKVEPQHLGVGMYQHDIKTGLLTTELGAVVEEVVNSVGVDVNTASPALLTHIAGLNAAVARNLVQWRDEHGPFKSRQELQKVKGLGPKSYEQCAGFLRIHQAANALDSTSVHPESYRAALQLVQHLQKAGTSETAGGGASSTSKSQQAAQQKSGKGLDWSNLQSVRVTLQKLQDQADEEELKRLAGIMGVGVPTLSDIISSLCSPERDIRGTAPTSIVRTTIGSIKDLTVGQELQGVVRNVVAFGAFVDINVGRDGLIPNASMHSRKLTPGAHVNIKVTQVDLDRQRISLALCD